MNAKEALIEYIENGYISKDVLEERQPQSLFLFSEEAHQAVKSIDKNAYLFSQDDWTKAIQLSTIHPAVGLAILKSPHFHGYNVLLKTIKRTTPIQVKMAIMMAPNITEADIEKWLSKSNPILIYNHMLRNQNQVNPLVYDYWIKQYASNIAALNMHSAKLFDLCIQNTENTELLLEVAQNNCDNHHLIANIITNPNLTDENIDDILIDSHLSIHSLATTEGDLPSYFYDKNNLAYQYIDTVSNHIDTLTSKEATLCNKFLESQNCKFETRSIIYRMLCDKKWYDKVEFADIMHPLIRYSDSEYLLRRFVSDMLEQNKAAYFSQIINHHVNVPQNVKNYYTEQLLQQLIDNGKLVPPMAMRIVGDTVLCEEASPKVYEQLCSIINEEFVKKNLTSETQKLFNQIVFEMVLQPHTPDAVLDKIIAHENVTLSTFALLEKMRRELNDDRIPPLCTIINTTRNPHSYYDGLRHGVHIQNPQKLNKLIEKSMSKWCKAKNYPIKQMRHLSCEIDNFRSDVASIDIEKHNLEAFEQDINNFLLGHISNFVDASYYIYLNMDGFIKDEELKFGSFLEKSEPKIGLANTELSF